MNIAQDSIERRLPLSCALLLVVFLTGCLSPVTSMPTVIPTIAFPTTTPRLEDSTIFTKILWLKDNALQVHSISPADEDFSDLQPLKQIIGDKRIVMLGEESHGDGNTFLAKTRLVKFLHQELGFGVIAFESGFYDCHKAWKMIQDGGSTNFAFKGSVFPIWSESSPVQPLISYLDQTKESEHPLILAGFDSQFTGEISKSGLLNDLTVFLNKYPEAIMEEQEWHNFLDRTIKLIAQAPAPNTDELAKYLDEISKLKQNIAAAAREGDLEVAYWVQFLDSLSTQAKFAFYVAGTNNQYRQAHPELNSLRDIQMGKNLIWLANEMYPDKKIIVWAATYHIARNLASVPSDNTDVQSQHENITTMGDIAGKALRDQIYSLGFTAYEGYFGSVFESPKKLNPPSQNSFEDMLHEANFNYAIVDFHNPALGGEWLQEPMISRPLGYQEETANWSGVLDGIMFIREMIPSTRYEP